MQQDMTFTLTIEAQEIVVHYWSQYFVTADYARFEFTSPHEPRRRIPVSETGYRSHFAPVWEIAEASSVEEYAYAVALTLMTGISNGDDAGESQGSQLALF